VNEGFTAKLKYSPKLEKIFLFSKYGMQVNLINLSNFFVFTRPVWSIREVVESSPWFITPLMVM
jgi:hypothetical protein